MLGRLSKCHLSIPRPPDPSDISTKLKAEIPSVEKLSDRPRPCGASRAGIGIDEASERERASPEDVI